MHVGISCIQGMVLIPCHESLLLHLSPHGQHRRQEDHQQVPFQASCHPSPGKTATDRIIDATTRLITAIAGVQDAPPNKMEAIQSLCTLLLWEVARLPPLTPSILPTPPPPNPVVNKDEPIIIWNPQLVQPVLPTHNLNTNDINSNCNTPAIVKDNGNNYSPIPSQRTHPPCHHLIRPLHNHPLTPNHLRLHTAHMMNCVIAEELMPTPALCTCPPSLHCRYAFTAKCILLKTISPPSHSMVHFIGAIIDADTGDVLKYQHLMKMDRHKMVWAHGFANEIVQLFQGIRNVPGTDTCFIIPNSLMFQFTNAPPTDAFAAITIHTMKRNIALGSPLAAIGLTIQETRAHQWPISPRPNNSSIPPSVPLGPSFWASTLPISTSTPPCRTPSTCISVSFTTLIKSSSITTFATLSLLMARSTSRFRRGCMVYPKPASLQIKYSKNALPSKGITNANIHLVSDTTSGNTSRSA
jgi:hypothetical protein